MGIEIRGMAPLLQVFDMPTSIAFYRDVVPAPLRNHNFLLCYNPFLASK